MTAAPHGWIPVVVDGIEVLADGVKQFALAHAAGTELPRFEPGSHVDVRLPDGLVRQYSLCDGPARNASTYMIAVKLAQRSRGGSIAMHRIQRGQQLGISAPRNLFPLHSGEAHAVLVAGGIGLTPLLSMARHLRADARPYDLYQFARSPAHALLAESGEGGAVFCGLGREAIEERMGEIVRAAPAASRFYVCGPQGFMDTFMAIVERSRPQAPVAFERFEAATSSTGSQQPFVIRLARTGIEIPVPIGTSILQALASHGVHAPSACEAGMCGTCVTTVLAGIPEHHDEFLSEQEKALGTSLCLCVSRAVTPELVLDL